jgi:hypothetical protein
VTAVEVMPSENFYGVPTSPILRNSTGDSPDAGCA